MRGERSRKIDGYLRRSGRLQGPWRVGRLISLALAFLVLSCAPARAELENWNSVTVEGRLAPDFGVQVTEETRTNAGGVYYNSTDVGFSRPTSKWFDDSGVGYLQIHTLSTGSGKWVQEDRLYANGAFRWRLGSIVVEDRNRVEYQMQGIPNARWQYGNRLKLSLPLRFGSIKPILYVSDEATLNISGKPARVIRNRARVGLSGKVWGALWADVFVQHQWTRKNSDTEGARKSSEALGVQLKLRF